MMEMLWIIFTKSEKLLRVGGLDHAGVAMHYPFSQPLGQDTCIGLVGNTFLCFLFLPKKYKSDPPLQFFFSLQFRNKEVALYAFEVFHAMDVPQFLISPINQLKEGLCQL